MRQARTRRREGVWLYERARCAALANIAFLSLWTRDHEQAEVAFGEIADAVPKGWVAVVCSLRFQSSIVSSGGA